jgi:small subunit ribosomal protein S20
MAKLKTGRHTSALKEHRKSVKRAVRNESQRTKIKTLAKKVEDAVAKKDIETAKKFLVEAFSQWDKAAKKNIIHKNASANQKARLSKIVGSLSAPK